MKTRVCFIKRQKLPSYNSIEELFRTLIGEIGLQVSTTTLELHYSGGSPFTMLKNILSLKSDSDVYHITGDVHYMALALKRPTVLTIHDVHSALKGNGLKTLYVKLFWFWLPALCVSRITVISDFTKGELAKIIPFAEHKIVVIPNPVSQDLSKAPFHFNASQPNVLLMGTKENKNLERSIEALAGIACKVTIIGALSDSQKSLMERKNIVYENHFNVDYTAIIACYKGCDLVCFPSTYEGFGMPIIEAQAIGRPVLTSNIGAMAEVAGEGAYLVDPFDEGAIKNGIMELLNSEAVRTELIQKGFENVQRFQTEHIAKDYMALYDDLIHT